MKMEITSSNSKVYADLQAVIAAARHKNATMLRSADENRTKINAANKTNSAAKTSGTMQSVRDVSINSGKLVDKLYGNSTKKQELTPIRVGSRFDAYA
jgi:hypothetical protein